MADPLVIHWFRRDLRLKDNPALHAASRAGRVLPVFLPDTQLCNQTYDAGEAGRWWLACSLKALHKSLGQTLLLLPGKPEEVLPQLAGKTGAVAVYAGRCYEPQHLSADKRLTEKLGKAGVKVHFFNGSMLQDPQMLAKKDGTPYRVFTPFYNNGLLQAPVPRKPLPVPGSLQLHRVKENAGAFAKMLMRILPEQDWHKKLELYWSPGESHALEDLKKFIRHALHNYAAGRDFPAQPAVSRLSPRLHAGELSPNQIWYAAHSCSDEQSTHHYCRELGWREFACHLLLHNPQMHCEALRPAQDCFRNKGKRQYLLKWQQGKTGYPFVDAGMRELWQTGFMHNRLRMITASFLIKNLHIDWRRGEQWFRDCLVDADLASNSAGWQWVAGCGSDASPWFRIFNPLTQGKKFDPRGEYIRKFVPELADVPDAALHCPQKLQAYIQKGGDKKAATYPLPVVDLHASREEALRMYREQA